jgi:asparagine N-glycosylation enzyme membrane subunit Stt3
MNKFLDLLVGPVGKEWCLISFILVIIALLSFVGALFGTLLAIFKLKKFSFTTIFSIVFALLLSGIAYMQSRVIYTMCMNSLK